MPEQDQVARDSSGEGTVSGAKQEIEALRELLQEVSQERRSLKTMLDYADMKTKELADKSGVFEAIEENITRLQGNAKKVEDRVSSIDQFQTRLDRGARGGHRPADRGARENGEGRSLNSLIERVMTRTKALAQQRRLVDKANEEAGRLNVLL